MQIANLNQLHLYNYIWKSLDHGLLQNIGVTQLDVAAPLVDIARFYEGCTLFAYDLSPDNCAGFHTHRDDRGTINLELMWGGALSAPITLIIYSVFHDELQLDAG